ncbi:dimethylsulfoniopropionate demethylase [Pelagibacteraceae bacterium]|nr:dimethylsulfoniopropionate demethylase [Pelagibacteraceae bacterium]
MSYTGLNMSRRIRRTPYTQKVIEAGVTGFTVVNHMLLPKAFKASIEEDYWHLSKNAQIWDVSCQRQVQITGPDAEKLVQSMSPRPIKNMPVGMCYYLPLIDENAGMINDPVLLKLSNDKYWISVADSDVLLWAKGLAVGGNLNVNIIEPDVYPLAIQGPKSEELMSKVFGEKIKKLKFFHFGFFDFLGTKQLIARSGYSKQDGFEVYLKGFNLGSKLWDTIWSAGKAYNISPGCPNLIDRIEAGLLSYGNEFTLDDNPFECGFDAYCKDLSHEFIGKKTLLKIKSDGIQKKIKGVTFDGDSTPPCTIPFPVYSNNRLQIGNITSGIYSPNLKTNIGLSMIDREYWNDGQEVIVLTPDNLERKGRICSLPFNYN